MWEKLQKRIEIVQPVGKVQKTPSRDELARFESTLGIPFPESYKSFVMSFGAGEIGGYFNIFAPGYPDKRSGSLQGLIDMIRKRNVQETLIETYKDAAFINRMLPFADTIAGDVIVWDPADVHDDRNCEYGIYVLPDDRNEVIAIAASFREFIEDVCLGDAFRQIAGPNWSVIEQFMPFGRRPK